MSNPFFDFSFSHWPSLLLSLVPALINLAIFTYVLFYVRKSSLSTAFLFFLFTLILWRLQEVVLQICITREAARMWYHMFAISTNFIGATGLHFVMVLIKKDKWKEKNYHIIALYLPTFLFSMFFASGIEYMDFGHTEKWGWVFTPSHPVSIAAFVLIGIHATSMMVLLAAHAWSLRKTRSDEFKRTVIILAGSSAPIIAGCTWQILLPIFFHQSPVPIASSVTIFFSFAILIAITRYNFLEYSPAHQWGDIVENMNEGILIADNRGVIQYVNNKFCNMLGFSAQELLNKRPEDIFALQNSLPANNAIEKRKNLFRNNYELKMRKKDGSYIICGINAQPYLDPDKKVVGSIGIYTDITERKASAKKIKESEARYRSLVEQATDGIFIADPSGNYIDVNYKACHMLGYSKAELLRMNIKDLLFQEDIRNSPPRFPDLGPGRSFLAVRNLKMKNGSALPTEINASMLPDGNLLGMVRDISERKRTEEDLLQKVQEMDAFIYRASHDLRGPLASISGLTAIGREEIGDKLAVLYFDKIRDSAERLDNILQELSKIARVTQAKIEPARLDLDKEISDILDSLKHIPNFSQIKILKEINVSAVFCDKILLIIILQNLIINSVNYYDTDKETHFIRIQALEWPDRTEIVISDNGIGIPTEIQEKVFEMFFRGSNISKGSGLGLYIVKNAVKKLKGTIHLESKEGEGATFTIGLPRSI